MFSQNLILQKAFETVTPMKEELKRTEFNHVLCKKFKLLVDRFSSNHFFAKGRTFVEKMIYQKKNRGHCTSEIVKSRKSYSNGHLPYHLSILLLCAQLMHDVACEFVCAEGCAEAISANILDARSLKLGHFGIFDAFFPILAFVSYSS